MQGGTGTNELDEGSACLDGGSDDSRREHGCVVVLCVVDAKEKRKGE